MPTQQELEDAATQVVTDSGIFHAVIHGGAADPDVPTEGGNIPTLAKQMALAGTAFADGSGVTTAANRKNWRRAIRADTKRRYIIGPNMGARAVKAALDNGLDTNILVLGDSTTDVVNSWVRKIADKLSAAYPANRRVEHRKINAASPATKYGWFDPTVIAAGAAGERKWTFPATRTINIVSMQGDGAKITVITATPHQLGVTEAITVAGNSIGGYNLFFDSYSGNGHVATVVDATTFTINSALNLGLGNGGTISTAPRWGLTTTWRSARGGFLGNHGTSRIRIECEISAQQFGTAGKIVSNFQFGFTAINEPTYLSIGNTGVLGCIFQRVPVQQVNTATVVGQVTTAGNWRVIVTAAGVTGSPITFDVPVKLHETEYVVAQRVRTALKANANLSALWDITGTEDKIVATRKGRAANDATFNINLGAAGTTAVGLTAAAASVATQAGNDQDYQFAANSTGFPDLVLNTRVRFAVEIQADNGANSVITYQYSTNGGQTWTTISTTNAARAINGIAWISNKASDYVYYLNSGGGIPCPGVTVHWAQIFVGENKEPILPMFDMSHWVTGVAQQRNLPIHDGTPTLRTHAVALSGQSMASMLNKTYGVQPLWPSRHLWLADCNYQMVIISLNYNDVGETRAGKVAKLKELLSYFCFPEATPPVVYIHTQSMVVDNNDAVSPLGKQTNARQIYMIESGSMLPGSTVLDTMQAARDYVAEGLGPITDLLMPQNPVDVHPDDDGYNMEAEVIVLEAILGSNDDYFEHTNYA